MRIVLDTSALFYPRALASLRSDHPGAEPVIPTVVLLERARQLSRAGLDGAGEMRAFVERGGLTLEAFGPEQALRSHQRAPRDDRLWARAGRDAIIAGHVAEGDVLWTANARDFLDLGLAREQVLDVRGL